MKGSEFSERFRVESTLRDVQDTLQLARIRCLPFDVLLQRLGKIGAGSRDYAIIYAVLELERSEEQNICLMAVLRGLKRVSDQAPSADRPWLDRQIGRILRTVPQKHAFPLIQEFLDDHRKGRRDVGFRSLRLQHVDAMVTKALLKRFKETSDERFVHALLRHPLLLDYVDPEQLIDRMSDEYWKMRVVEATLRADVRSGAKFAAKAPRFFIWAGGRVGDPTLIPDIAECFRRANDKIEIAGITAWAYGKLGAMEELEVFAKELVDMFPNAAADGRG